jgi:hypothetical protein
MALKPPVSGGRLYEVSFRASAQSAGVTLLTVGWIPKHAATVPPLEDEIVAAGATGSIRGRIPAATAARRMEIRVDLPDGLGFGTLTLKVDGAFHSESVLSKDTTWTSLVE